MSQLNTLGPYVLGAVSHLNKLDWHDMLLFGGIGLGLLIVIARLLMRG